MSIPGFFAEFGSVDENASKYRRLSFRGQRQPPPGRITGAFIAEDWWGDGDFGGGAGGPPGLGCALTCSSDDGRQTCCCAVGEKCVQRAGDCYCASAARPS